ncbi:MAG TPA: hypothetical protein H9899_15110 [Candidatus Sphingomonas excrementigallinarum]|nr:hypothetical protein [Candidatus Sphingomonas excrementigallinarum]
MRRARRWPLALGATAIGLAALAGGLWRTHGPAPTSRPTTIAVVGGATPAASAPVVVAHAPVAAPAAPPVTTAARKPHVAQALARSDSDTRHVAELMQQQPRDVRGDAIEERVRTAFSGHFAGRVLGEVKVACTITLCEVSGTANGDPEAARAAFRAPAVQQAFAAIGYSGGEEVVAGHDGQTDFVFYVNREA